MDYSALKNYILTQWAMICCQPSPWCGVLGSFIYNSFGIPYYKGLYGYMGP